ncbi:uncharacterized protein LOC108668844 [Hyalella azteca]|uniref:Uncharacterized protein LOC108668844 n=1 Tax=Hyalella azteca TaxID=294128 RepID=A0A8B7NDB6_HYAAZ|nr:uncharacterized protein LOC108668844 [Hyalella azteca]
MMKSVGLFLLLIAAFAYSGVEGANPCATALKAAWLDYTIASGTLRFPNSATSACGADPAGHAAIDALRGDCQSYNFSVGDLKCDVVAAPYMKCVAGKLGYLNDDGSINTKKIFAQYKADATSGRKCSFRQYDFAVAKCGTNIDNYAFLKKVQCIITATDKFTAG